MCIQEIVENTASVRALERCDHYLVTQQQECGGVIWPIIDINIWMVKIKMLQMP
jgi:hypothetical protein